MLRTQVYLTEDLSREIKIMALKENKPAANIIRRLLADGIQNKTSKTNAGSTLLEISKMAVKGPSDLSSNFSDYLFGKKSDYARKDK